MGKKLTLIPGGGDIEQLLASPLPDDEASTIRLCDGLSSTLPQMTEEQCERALRIFDGSHLQTEKKDGKIVVISPENLAHHLQSVRIRLQAILEAKLSRLRPPLKKG